MIDIMLIALGSIAIAIEVVKRKLRSSGVSPRKLREYLVEAQEAS